MPLRQNQFHLSVADATPCKNKVTHRAQDKVIGANVKIQIIEDLYLVQNALKNAKKDARIDINDVVASLIL